MIPIPTVSSGFPCLVALGGCTHDKKIAPVRQDWNLMSTDKGTNTRLFSLYKPFTQFNFENLLFAGYGLFFIPSVLICNKPSNEWSAILNVSIKPSKKLPKKVEDLGSYGP